VASVFSLAENCLLFLLLLTCLLVGFLVPPEMFKRFREDFQYEDMDDDVEGFKYDKFPFQLSSCSVQPPIDQSSGE
jgi:hypothetical protein